MMHRPNDHRSRSAKPLTIHGYAQSGDLLGFQKLLRDNPSLLNDTNPVVRFPSLLFSFLFLGLCVSLSLWVNWVVIVVLYQLICSLKSLNFGGLGKACIFVVLVYQGNPECHCPSPERKKSIVLFIIIVFFLVIWKCIW